MTPDRAKALYRNRTPMGGVEASPAERQFVSEVRATLPGKCSWLAALQHIANGGVVQEAGGQHVSS